MEILTSVKRLYISFKSLVNDSVYSFGRAALLLMVEVQNHTVPVRERGRIRDNRLRTVSNDGHQQCRSSSCCSNETATSSHPRVYIARQPKRRLLYLVIRKKKLSAMVTTSWSKIRDSFPECDLLLTTSAVGCDRRKASDSTCPGPLCYLSSDRLKCEYVYQVSYVQFPRKRRQKYVGH